MFQTKAVEKIETRILCLVTFFPLENRAVHEIMWKNTVRPDRPQIRRMRFACCVRKATNTHSEYALLVVFPLQQWLHECASITLYVHSPSYCYYV